MLAEGAMSTVGPVLLVAGAIVLVISLGRLARRRGTGAGRSGGDEDAEAVRRVREAGERELARIEDHARRARAEIETKTRVMNGLLVRAEKAIARLEKEGGGAPTDRAAPSEKPPGVQSGTGGAGRQERPGPPGKLPGDPRFAEVYRLADDGLGPAEIAARTEFERGEVELILGLRGAGPPKEAEHPEEAE
jgi:hypothetical protein